MAVDPQFAGILAMMKTLPPMRLMPLALARDQPVPAGETPVAQIEDRDLPTPSGALPVRLYHPRPGETLPLLVFFHGGGFVLGGLNSHDELARRLAVAGGCAVLSVAYRLAPEHPYPAALDDAAAAIRWAAANAAAIGADGGRIAVGGDSAGGNIAAAASLRLRDEAGDEHGGGPKLAGQLLIYPLTDLAGPRTGSMLETGEGFFMSQDDMDFFRESYAAGSDRTDPLISPARAASLAGLPPALVITAECDALRDQGQAYARQLAEAGVAAQLAHYPGAIHGFLTFPGPMGGQAADRAGAWLRDIFGRRPVSQGR